MSVFIMHCKNLSLTKNYFNRFLHYFIALGRKEEGRSGGRVFVKEKKQKTVPYKTVPLAERTRSPLDQKTVSQ